MFEGVRHGKAALSEMPAKSLGEAMIVDTDQCADPNDRGVRVAGNPCEGF
jgi:hypothetical protein